MSSVATPFPEPAPSQSSSFTLPGQHKAAKTRSSSLGAASSPLREGLMSVVDDHPSYGKRVT
eukprot:2644710-Karenia_brevis.AAC.1